MGWGERVARRVLAARSPWVQLAAQPAAGWLARTLGREFSRWVSDWNGRRACLLISFDCDFPEDALALPEIAAALGECDLRGSFACVGRWVEDYTDAHRAVLDAGHEFFNHTYSHPELHNSAGHFVSARDDFNPRPWQVLSAQEQREEISRCQDVVSRLLNTDMQGFRVPHFGNLDARALYPVLEDFGLIYSSSVPASRAPRLGVPVAVGRVLEIPVSTCPRHPLTVLDSWHAFYAKGGWHRDDFADLLERYLRDVLRWGGLINLYLDPKDRRRLDFPGLFTRLAAYRQDCWMPTYLEFTRWWRQCMELRGGCGADPPGGNGPESTVQGAEPL